jgi:uncharacterized repeat protein (TIGR03803 family)
MAAAPRQFDKSNDNFLYGMTPDGGANYNGTIFKINNTGTSFNVLKPCRQFAGRSALRQPAAGIGR